MDLSTNYLGFKLPHPFMPGASPMADDLDTVRRLEDAGASAIVLRSLFEEQIIHEQMGTFLTMEMHGESFAEALSYFPSPEKFKLGPEEYLDQIRRVKRAVKVPVIASLNGTSIGGWLDHAQLMEQAGADAIELNVYALGTDPAENAQLMEDRTVEMVSAVKAAVKVPIAVKLSPFYTSIANIARRLVKAGADGLVLFNRFYQPDIDIEQLQVERTLHLSTSSELNLRLRWLAILSGRIRGSLAVTGGVHTAVDAIKSIMTGACAVQMVSALLQRGPAYLKTVRQEVAQWMESHEYESLEKMRGNMNLASCPDSSAYERANYMLLLQSWTAAK